MHFPIRVAQVMGVMNGGGVEAVVMNYYRHIDRSKVQFDFIVNENSKMVPEEEIRSLGGRVYYVPSYGSIVKYQRALMRLFEDECWTIVHSHINALSVFSLSAAKKAGVPIRIAHSHSTSGKGEYAKNAVKAVLKTQANRYPTHKLGCSRYAGEWLFGKNADFDILFNAIELNKFAFDARLRAKTRAELGLNDNQFTIGHVGRFMEQKNHRFLIEVFDELHRRDPNSILLLAGDGEMKPFVEGLVAERGLAGCVRFLGQRDDANRLYQAFDAFVLPSLYEGLVLVGVEAQRAGLPCYLADTITEEVKLCDKVCFLSLDSVKDWSDAILLGMGSSRNVAVERFSKYDICEAAKKLERYYLVLCGE